MSEQIQINNSETDAANCFLNACHESGIKYPMYYLNAITPKLFGWLTGSFPRGILPMDIDGEVEINGYFLRIESKHENAIRSESIPTGQCRALWQLLGLERFHVLLIGINDANEPTCSQLWHPKHGKLEVKNDDADGIRHFCTRWSEWADNQKPINMEHLNKQ